MVRNQGRASRNMVSCEEPVSAFRDTPSPSELTLVEIIFNTRMRQSTRNHRSPTHNLTNESGAVYEVGFICEIGQSITADNVVEFGLGACDEVRVFGEGHDGGGDHVGRLKCCVSCVQGEEDVRGPTVSLPAPYMAPARNVASSPVKPYLSLFSRIVLAKQFTSLPLLTSRYTCKDGQRGPGTPKQWPNVHLQRGIGRGEGCLQTGSTLDV